MDEFFLIIALPETMESANSCNIDLGYILDNFTIKRAQLLHTGLDYFATVRRKMIQSKIKIIRNTIEFGYTPN